MDHCHLCAQAETYLATGPLANEAAAESRLVTLDLTLRHHRVQRRALHRRGHPRG